MTERGARAGGGAQNRDLPVPASTANDAMAEAIVRPERALAARGPRGIRRRRGAGRPPPGVAALRTSPARAATNDARWGALDIVPTKADYVLDLIRMNSLWPLLSGLACCAIEMMSTADQPPRHRPLGDVPVPRVAAPGGRAHRGRDAHHQDGRALVRLWAEMPEPKWCVAMGDCTCSGGRYKRSYSTVQGIDRVLPVDVYVPAARPGQRASSTG